MSKFPTNEQVNDAVFFLRVQRVHYGNRCDGSCDPRDGCTCAVQIDWDAFFMRSKPKSRIGLAHYQILEKHYCMLGEQFANWQAEKKLLASYFPKSH